MLCSPLRWFCENLLKEHHYTYHRTARVFHRTLEDLCFPWCERAGMRIQSQIQNVKVWVVAHKLTARFASLFFFLSLSLSLQRKTRFLFSIITFPSHIYEGKFNTTFMFCFVFVSFVTPLGNHRHGALRSPRRPRNTGGHYHSIQDIVAFYLWGGVARGRHRVRDIPSVDVLVVPGRDRTCRLDPLYVRPG